MTDEEDIDGLAAEYVLGSLDEAERKEVNARRRTDASLSSAIEAWERRLGPMNERAPGLEPPSHLLNGILARIPEQKRRRIRSADVVPLRAIAKPWRSRSIGTAALAACLVLVVGWLIHVQTPAPKLQVGGMDCSRLYKDFWVKFSRERLANIPAEQAAGVSRMTLRAYDACQAGDDVDSNALFHRLQRTRF
jgi:hypothetical protein